MSNDLITIFRSADSTAEEDAAAVCAILEQAGIDAVLLTERDPGVPVGSVEVRVSPAQEEAAEAALSVASNAQEPGDASHALDLVTVFEGVGATGELEAISLRAVLEANEIPTIVVGAYQIPNLPFLVKVPQSHLEEARQAIAEARRAGPAAAEEAQGAAESGEA